MPKQLGCVTLRPTAQSVRLGGKYINLSAIARSQGIDHSYLSRIFSGERECRVSHARKIAAALGMGLEEFLDALDARKEDVQRRARDIEAVYQKRIETENLDDVARLQSGKPPIPRMPGLRRLA